MTDRDMKRIKVAWKKRCQLKAKGREVWNKGNKLREKGNKVACSGDRMIDRADTIFEAAVSKIQKGQRVIWYNNAHCILQDGTSLEEKGAK